MGELQVKVEIPGILEFFNFQYILFNSDPQGNFQVQETFSRHQAHQKENFEYSNFIVGQAVQKLW